MEEKARGKGVFQIFLLAWIDDNKKGNLFA
jgi:hypothetical protein